MCHVESTRAVHLTIEATGVRRWSQSHNCSKSRVPLAGGRVKNDPRRSETAHDLTPSVVALRLLRLKRSNSLIPLVGGTPTTQEVEATSSLGHGGGYSQPVSPLTLFR